MKKLIAGVAAGAILLSAVTVVLATSPGPFMGSSQWAITNSTTGAYSSTGGNVQTGKGSQTIWTGDSYAQARSLTLSNLSVNLGGKGSTGSQMAFTSSNTGATSTTGGNVQTLTSGRGKCSTCSSQVIWSGDSEAVAGSATVSNVSISLGFGGYKPGPGI